MPEELLAALNFAALEGSTPPWAAGGKNWDPENGGLAECHIQVRLDVRRSVVHGSAMWQGLLIVDCFPVLFCLFFRFVFRSTSFLLS